MGMHSVVHVIEGRPHQQNIQHWCSWISSWMSGYRYSYRFEWEGASCCFLIMGDMRFRPRHPLRERERGKWTVWDGKGYVSGNPFISHAVSQPDTRPGCPYTHNCPDIRTRGIRNTRSSKINFNWIDPKRKYEILWKHGFSTQPVITSMFYAVWLNRFGQYLTV